MTLPICTFMWGDKYGPEHIWKLRDMLARNLSLPWELVVISDQPVDHKPLSFQSSYEGFRYIPLWEEMRNAKLCGVRLHAFSPEMKDLIGPRFAWIDLDVVIVSSVDHIFSRTEPFVSAQPPRPPMPINGSLVMMDAGKFAHVASTWTLEKYHAVGRDLAARWGIKAGTTSDEGWMWDRLGATYGRAPVHGKSGTEWATYARGIITKEQGLYYFRRDLSSGHRPLPKNASIVVMNGRSFDPAAPRWQQRCPWIVDHWREGL